MPTACRWAILACLSVAAASAVELTPAVLGKPNAKDDYSNNPWDLRAYGGRVYIGSGDANANTGPVTLWAYDPATSSFVDEAVLDQEMIDHFRVIDGELWIPGIDQRGGGPAVYVRGSGGLRTLWLPGGIEHVFDVDKCDGKIFAAVGRNSSDLSVLRSDDDGASWSEAVGSPIFRCYHFLVVGADFFALPSIFPGNGFSDNKDTPYWTGTGFADSDCGFPEAFPGFAATTNGSYVLNDAGSLNGTTLYIGLLTADDGSGRVGLYAASRWRGGADTREIAIAGWSIEASIIRNGKAYALAWRQRSDGAYDSAVFSSTDTVAWSEDFTIRYGAAARSFETLNGTWYIGIGSHGDSSLSGTILSVTTSTVPPVNAAPQVAAGSAATVTLPGSLTLAGTVTDDGLPSGTLTWTWTADSGPGTVTFGNAASPTSTASFSVAGTYVLRLTGSDGALSASATVTITVQAAPPINQAPVVDAGGALTVTLPAGATLAGSATDDGLPSGALTSTWTVDSGPGTVIFADAASPTSTASFSVVGTYVLRLTGSDGALSASATVAITVQTAVPANTAPVIVLTVPSQARIGDVVTATVSVTDDGLPAGSTPTVTWTAPGAVLTPSAGGCTLTYAAPGTYLVTASASDGALTGSAQRSITVLSDAQESLLERQDDGSRCGLGGVTALILGLMLMCRWRGAVR